MTPHTAQSALACLLSTALLSACGGGGSSSDSPSVQPPEPKPPQGVETVSEAPTPQVRLISHSAHAGAIDFEFELLNQGEVLVTGLEEVKAMAAEKVPGMGFVQSPDGSHGGQATADTQGAQLSEVSPGRYSFHAPMPGLDGSEELIVWLQAGQLDNAIGLSTPLIVQRDVEEFSTKTEDCYRCHVDYGASQGPHAEYVAIDTQGNTDFIAGCKVCHNDVNREKGGFAQHTLSSLGHVNHKSFERVDFTMNHCQSCHSGTFEQIDFSIGCIDCHSDSPEKSGISLAQISGYSQSDQGEIIQLHDKLNILQQYTREHRTSATSAPFHRADIDFGAGPQQAVCVTTEFVDTSGDAPQHLNIEEMLASGQSWDLLVDIKAYFNGRIAGVIADYAVDYQGWGPLLVTPGQAQGFAEANGDWTTCFPTDALETRFLDADLVAVSRLFLSKEDMPFMSYSPVTGRDLVVKEEYRRIQRVNQRSCDNCHNVSRFTHNTIDGAKDCLVCHDQGMAPGFSMGASAHRWHFGKVTPNLAPKVFSGDDCMVCHEGGVEMEAVPNQYKRSNWMPFNGSDQHTNKLASPIMAACFDCHQDAVAVNHMEAMGGEYSVEVTEDWYRRETNEACTVCHGIGSSVGLEQFHKFDRATGE